jgi:hypothetical protein
MMQLGPEICHVDRCPHGCTYATGCKGIEVLKPKYVIDSLHRAQAEMLAAANHMRRAGIEQHPEELEGAATIINSWVEGIAAAGVAGTQGGLTE